VKRALKLAHGLIPIGGAHKRMVLAAMAFYAKANGKGRVSDRKLRNATELGRDLFTRILRELETDGWIRREGNQFILAICKMEENQRFLLNPAEYEAERDCSRCVTTKLGA